MSSTKRILIILASIVLFTIVAILYQQQASELDEYGDLFLPDLEDSINEIVQIDIKSGKSKVKILKDGDYWVVADQKRYFADPAKIREIILGLAELKIIEKKTANPYNFAKLGVNAAGKEGAGVEITLRHEKFGDKLFSVIVGKMRRGKAGYSDNGFYIRQKNEDQVWLVEGDMDIAINKDQWLYKKILELPMERIKRVVIDYSGDNKVVLSRNEARESFFLEDVPSGKQVKMQSEIDTIATVLSNLSFEQVVKKKDIEFSESRSLDVSFETFDGLLIDLTLVTEDGKGWIKFDAASSTDEEKIVEEAEKINAHLANWAYNVPDYVFDSLTKKKSELIK